MSIEVQISWKLLHYGARVQFLGGSCSLNTMRKDSILFFFYADIRMKIKKGSLPFYFSLNALGQTCLLGFYKQGYIV